MATKDAEFDEVLDVVAEETASCGACDNHLRCSRCCRCCGRRVAAVVMADGDKVAVAVAVAVEE